MILKKNKKIQYLVGIFCIFIAIMIIFSDYGIIKRISLEMKTAELQKEISLQKQTTDSMQNVIDKLNNDTVVIEKIASEKYGMSKKKEDIYYIKPKNKIKKLFLTCNFSQCCYQFFSFFRALFSAIVCK